LAPQATGWNGEQLRDADQILKNRHALPDAAIEVDALAWLRAQTRFYVGHAFAMHDPPQSVRIGAGRNDERGHERDDDEAQNGEF
jgi:hypothetical protein